MVENFVGVFNGYSFLNHVGEGCLQRNVINVEADTLLHLKLRATQMCKTFL
jgi:hypothetical protein